MNPFAKKSKASHKVRAGVLITSLVAVAVAVGQPAHAAQTLVAPAVKKPKEVKAQYVKKGRIVVLWSGAINTAMVQYFEQLDRRYNEETHRLVLVLNSPGGQVDAGEQVIAILRRIKKTHELETVVLHGHRCSSMCINIFAQGNVRRAATSSIFTFHEAVLRLKDGRLLPRRSVTLRLFRKYLLPIGVPTRFLNALTKHFGTSDVVLSGRDLIEAKSRLITNVLRFTRKRSKLVRRV